MPKVTLQAPKVDDALLCVLAGNRFIERLSKSRRGKLRSNNRNNISRFLRPDRDKLEADNRRFFQISRLQELRRHQRLVGEVQKSVNERLKQLAN